MILPRLYNEYLKAKMAASKLHIVNKNINVRISYNRGNNIIRNDTF